MTELIDAFGRKIDYLRISLTDRCNLRCRYCMPEEGIASIPHREILTLEEVYRITRVLTELGIRRIRITGGEPLVRKNVMHLIRQLATLPEKPELALTTNGVLLAEYLPELAEAGLRSVNISLDTMDRDTYRSLTGVDGLEQVLQALEEAIRSGFQVKLNVVPIRGVNDKELLRLAELARERDVTVRFIELMPMGCAMKMQGVPGEEILQRMESEWGTFLSVREEEREGQPGEAKEEPNSNEEIGPHGPARYVRFPDFQGKIGLIDPMSHSFCSSCNRVRLTADGRLKLCLYYPDGPDLRKLLRNGCSDDELKEAIREGILFKPERHSFTRPGKDRDRRNMNEIGG